MAARRFRGEFGTDHWLDRHEEIYRSVRLVPRPTIATKVLGLPSQNPWRCSANQYSPRPAARHASASDRATGSRFCRVSVGSRERIRRNQERRPGRFPWDTQEIRRGPGTLPGPRCLSTRPIRVGPIDPSNQSDGLPRLTMSRSHSNAAGQSRAALLAQLASAQQFSERVSQSPTPRIR